MLVEVVFSLVVVDEPLLECETVTCVVAPPLVMV
jgi:hypothetical protein